MNSLHNLLNDIVIDENQYYPPGWIHNGLDFKQTIIESEKLKNKSKKSLNNIELAIFTNAALLRSCYGTPEFLLELGNYFIGLYDQDPFHNPYSLIDNRKYSISELVKLDGSCESKNGFNIQNWVGCSLLVNPPFSDLSEGATLCNAYCNNEKKPGIVFICNLDFSIYFQKCMKYADYLIILGRVQFKPMPGLKNSQPTGSSAMFIYNSNREIDTQFIEFQNRKYYCINLKNKKCANLDGNELKDLLK